MSKESIIRLLEKSGDKALSGQKIATHLGISRNAVWKNINSLKADGFEIESSKQGYILRNQTKEVSAAAIKSRLDFPLHIYLHQSIDSTNTYAISNISSLHMPALIIALEQTAGRGRLNKAFSSEKGDGIYMSFVLENNAISKNIHLVTAMSAVAIVRASKKVLNEDLKIKWVNDIFRGTSKVCGILTEGITNFETASISHIVIGIGINTDTKKLPEELREIASSISDTPIDINCLIAEISKEIHSLYRELSDGNISFLEDYRRHSMILGRNIAFKHFGEGNVHRGLAMSIEDDGSLTLKKENGELVNFISGEVSILVN